MARYPVERYVDHARRFGVEGVKEAALGDLDERELERLRRQLLDQLGLRVRFTQSALPAPGKSVTNAPLQDMTCVVCRTPLDGRRRHARTCSLRCRKRLQRRGGK